MCVFFSGFSIGFAAGAVDVSAQAAVLMVAETGEVLFERNAHKQLSMASTTKIMTSLLALESGVTSSLVTVSEPMVKVEGTSMGLLPGDTVSVYGLVCGMLMASGNDAANVTAYVLGGSPESFAVMMNDRARELNMTNTHFVTPSGLDAEGHCSTAYDMALLGRAAIGNPVFKSICSRTEMTIFYGSPPYRRTLSNHNRLLHSYPGAIGVKTGFTKKSGRCLVSAAQRGGVTLIAVTLNAPDDWNDHKKMLDYGFSVVNVTELDGDLADVRLKVMGGEKSSVKVAVYSEPSAVLDSKNGGVSREILLRPFEYAPVETGKPVGVIRYHQGTKLVHEAYIVTAEAAEYKAAPQVREPANEEQRKSIFEKIREYLKNLKEQT